jgi:hypothetical protein
MRGFLYAFSLACSLSVGGKTQSEPVLLTISSANRKLPRNGLLGKYPDDQTAECAGILCWVSLLSPFVRFLNCRRFCDGRASTVHHVSIEINRAAPTSAAAIT